MKVKLLALTIASLTLGACSSDHDQSERPNHEGTITISGTVQSGSTLSTELVEVDGFVADNVAYAWFADGVAIDGATDDSFDLTDDQVGSAITVQATYTDGLGNAEMPTSDATVAVTELPDTDDGAAVSIEGSAQVGQTLTAVVDDPDGATGSIAYQWLADDVAIDGATSSTYTLTGADVGVQLSVSAVYTDDEGFDADVTSEQTAAVVPVGVNVAGVLNVSDTDSLVVGDQLTAVLTDGNGAAGSIAYVWKADGTAIDGATTETFILTDDQAGTTVSVEATYVDDAGYSEDVTFTATDIVYDHIAQGNTSLATAATNAEDGDYIGIANASGDTYVDGGEIIFAAADLTIQRTANSTAVVSGAFCYELAGNGITFTNVAFENINHTSGTRCDDNGDSVVFLNGDGITFSHNTMTGQSTGTGISEFSWVSVKGFQHTIERNTFSDPNGERDRVKGGVLTFYNNSTPDSHEGHTVRYNLIKDIGFSGADDSSLRNSSGYVFWVGRSTSEDGREDGLNTFEYNLVKNVFMDRRYARVQSAKNVFQYNSFLDGSGAISFEDGAENQALYNIIINSLGDTNDDGGIAYSAYGHTISHNYIAGLRTTSNERAGLLANSDVGDNTSNAAVDISAVTVSNNTLVNNREAIEFTSKSCSQEDDFIVNFESNLVANGEDFDASIAGALANGEDETAITDECAIDATSTFNNNHVYSETLAKVAGDFFAGVAGTGNIGVDGSEGGADVVQNPDNGLLMGQNTDAGIGADTTKLVILDETMVGSGSTWTPTVD